MLPRNNHNSFSGSRVKYVKNYGYDYEVPKRKVEIVLCFVICLVSSLGMCDQIIPLCGNTVIKMSVSQPISSTTFHILLSLERDINTTWLSPQYPHLVELTSCFSQNKEDSADHLEHL
jgi:hypothetical protein